MRHSFGSDNHSGAAPEIIDAIIEANKDFQVAYGEDEYTQKAVGAIKRILGESAIPIFCFQWNRSKYSCIKAMTNTF
jgi:Threonine aldolase